MFASLVVDPWRSASIRPRSTGPINPFIVGMIAVITAAITAYTATSSPALDATNGLPKHATSIAMITGTTATPRVCENSKGVNGRAKPATDGRAKTGHFETKGIRSLPGFPDSCREVLVRWRIYSKWRICRQFCPFTGMAGRTGGSPASWASTARRSGITCDRPIQNRPARPPAFQPRLAR